MFVLFILDQAVNKHFSKNVKNLKDQCQSFMCPPSLFSTFMHRINRESPGSFGICNGLGYFHNN